MLIPVLLDLFQKGTTPWIIENVPNAPLPNPVILCGAMFDGLLVYRHRAFSSSLTLTAPMHKKHVHKIATESLSHFGAGEGGFVTVAGNLFRKAEGERAMGIDWMKRTELAEAIPPAYTEYLGRQIMEHLTKEKETQ